jgi:hypothetical protein
VLGLVHAVEETPDAVPAAPPTPDPAAPVQDTPAAAPVVIPPVPALAPVEEPATY